jgi:transposase
VEVACARNAARQRRQECRHPPKANRKHTRDNDKELYKARHRVENFFAKLRQFRAIATRYDKTRHQFHGGNLPRLNRRLA